MGMQKVLIADSSEDFLLAMAEVLQLRYHVLLCRDGNTALRLLRQEQCDLLVVDLHLPELDGMHLLETAMRERICPPVLALTPLLNEYVIQSAGRLGIRYLMRKPCDVPSVTSRAEDLLQEFTTAAFVIDRQRLAELLMQLSIRPNLGGYKYLMDCVPQYAADPDQRFTKELYPGVGKKYHRTGDQVERTIRNALDTAWVVRNDAVWQQCFACGDSRPAVSEVVARLAELLRKKQE